MGRTECNRVVNFARPPARLVGQLIDVTITEVRGAFAARRAVRCERDGADAAVSAWPRNPPTTARARRRRPSPRRSPSGRRWPKTTSPPTAASAEAPLAQAQRRRAAARPSSRRQTAFVNAAAKRAQKPAPARRSW